MIEGEEDGTEEGGSLIGGIWLELFVDIDDESRANGGEQTRLQDEVRPLTGARVKRRTNMRVVSRSSLYLLTYSTSYLLASLS